jgi:hypothetical protein
MYASWEGYGTSVELSLQIEQGSENYKRELDYKGLSSLHCMTAEMKFTGCLSRFIILRFPELESKIGAVSQNRPLGILPAPGGLGIFPNQNFDMEA